MTKLENIYQEQYDDPTMQKLVDLEKQRLREEDTKRKNKEFVTFTDTQLELISSVAGLKAKEVTKIATELIESGIDVSALADAWMTLQGHKEYIYVTGFDAWYKWNGRAWESDYKRTIDRDITAYLRYLNKLFSRFNKLNNDKAYTKAIDGWLNLTNVSPQKINSVKDVSSTLSSISAGEFDTLNVINFPNGTYNLDTFEFKPHDKKDYQTYCASFAYDSTATCPMFEKFLTQICVNNPGDVVDVMEWITDFTMIDLLQEFAGLCLTNDNSLDTSILGKGEGANGKSTLIEVFAAVLGRLSMPFDFDSLSKNAEYALSTLPGKRLIFATESANKQAIDTKYLNTIISGEALTARAPYGTAFVFNPQCKVFWAMNDLPRMNSTKQGAWRRLIIMPFFREFTAAEKDPGLSDKLMTELPGIFNWMVEGLKRLRANNNVFTESDTCKEAKDKYQGVTNNIIGFVKFWLEPTSYDNALSGAELYQAYQAYAKAKTDVAVMFGKTKFGAFIKTFIKENKRTNEGHRYAVKLNATAIAKIKELADKDADVAEFWRAVKAQGFN